MRFLLNSSLLAKTSRVSRALPPHHAFTAAVRQTARSSREQSSPSRGKHSLSRVAAAKLYHLNHSEAASEQQTHSQHQRDARHTYAIFRKLALAQFDNFVKTSINWASSRDEWVAFGIASKLDLDKEARLFRAAIGKACDAAADRNAVSRADNPLFWSLRNAFVARDVDGLASELKFAFQNFLMRSKFPDSILATHQKITDMRFPYEWFPATRALQRTVHLHVGPTNSGKTYNALKALENAKSGIYAGPLRLLAHEVYSRFIAKGKSCALITGEEQRIPDDVDVYFKSCTVEMTPVNSLVDVAVIDEIQMISDPDRGFAWTQAFLGVQAKEVHLCGEDRAVELIQSLCATLGDKCIVHRYERLSGLEVMKEGLSGRLENLQKGDAIVSFSRVNIHALRGQIEEATGKRCAVVYGSLPPETRAQQAALFNDPDNDFDYLAASDAIGMGLNLEIRRVVFEATHKRDSVSWRQMSVSEVKQIGGRAGRYRTANDAIRAATSDGEPPTPRPSGPGLVTTLEDEDLAIVSEAFQSEPPPIKTAGLQPPTAAIERLSTYFPPNTPLSFILRRFYEIGRVSSRFHFCMLKEMLEIADLIQPFSMSIFDRCVFLNAPVSLRDPGGAKLLQSLARCVSRMEGGDLLDIPGLQLSLLEIDGKGWVGGPSRFLHELEALHRSITLYLWLSYRFTGVFRSQKLAFHVKGLVEEKINEALTGISLTIQSTRRIRDNIRKRALAQQLKEEELSELEIPEDENLGDWGRPEPRELDLDEITRLEPRSGRRPARG
ncbi:P-loop containing nucleoside triphosphate hydrolase protein [Xylaria palmicola]|nr:P-loop containing nucleoside triphosphate hydrolase protein [Xylaria palmicola]